MWYNPYMLDIRTAPYDIRCIASVLNKLHGGISVSRTPDGLSVVLFTSAFRHKSSVHTEGDVYDEIRTLYELLKKDYNDDANYREANGIEGAIRLM